MNTIQTGNRMGLGLQAMESATPAQATPKAEPKLIGTTPSTSAQPSQGEINQALDRANKALESMSASNEIQFSIHEATGINVVKLVDQQTGDIIRQFPSKEILAIAESLDQSQSGAVVKQKV